jgi:NitT/TauT family transport system ATP-binding protein
MRPLPQFARRPQLRLRGVTKHFVTQGKRLHVLDRIDLDVEAGEFLSILGPSGSGKSTLLHLIAGLERPDDGEIWLDGHPISEPGLDRVVVFQDGALFPWLTALENVAFGLASRNLSAAEQRERAMAALERVRLAKFAGAYPHQLSGGMRQRVAIARALALEPRILLMDEPFAALDAQTRNVMHEELQQIWTGTGQTIIFITHNVNEALRLGDRVLLLSYRPARIRREVWVDLPRPRRPEDPHLAEMRAFLLRELKADVQAAVEEELGDG